MKGKRPATPEDTVFFSLFTRTGGEDNIEEKLHSLRTDCLAVALSLSEGYIWQHETFDLSLNVNNLSDASRSSTASSCPCASPPELEFADDHAEGELYATDFTPLPPHLHGKLKYGDNIEDEWFVVFILFAISRQYPDICIRVWDTDGEFLLIEAAYSIPSWLKPENSWNRVFIKNGEIHILPLPSSPAELFQLPLRPSIQDALGVFYGGNFRTRADNAVQEAIMRKLSEFQQNSNHNMHNVVCKVPLPIAQILKHEPQLVALAVGAFYDRDLDSMKAASRMNRFLPSGEELRLVDVMVRLSRAMYAQLKQQVFQAPRSYPMPNLSDSHYAEAEIGMKLTCGFEMMYWDWSDRDAHGKSSVANTRGSKNVGWHAFLGSLKQTGYFKDLLEGSKEYRELMEHAVCAYQKTSLAARASAAMNAPIQRIMEVLALPHSVKDFPSCEALKSDDDSWLYNGEDELTNALLERQKELDMYEREKAIRKTKQRQNLPREKRTKGNFSGDEVVKNMRAFVDKISSYEGAELPTDKDDDEPIALTMETFMEELKSAFGSELETCPFNNENSPLDEMDGSSSESDSDVEGIESREPMDDDHPGISSENGMFMEEYGEALSRELTSSSLAKSFVPVEKNATTSDKNKGPDEDMEGLPPVNIDMNLLKNILASYSSQHGLPGPATNLLGAMGLNLPDNKDNE